jgi:hypothetical protein
MRLFIYIHAQTNFALNKIHNIDYTLVYLTLQGIK